MSEAHLAKQTLQEYEKAIYSQDFETDSQGSHSHDGPALELTPSRMPNLTQVLTRTLSKVRTADTIPLTPPPDGGTRAWVMVLLTHCVIFNVWGFINSFGLFQTYYVNEMKIGGPSQVAWIGSMQMFIPFITGTFSGRALDAGYFRLTFISGCVIYLAGLLTLSFCDKYWQVLLTQGVVVGLGFGMVFVPSLALCSTYFLHKRTTALGVVTAGAASGGLVFPAIATTMLPAVGFAWTVRTMALVEMILAIICAVFLKPRLPPRKTGPIVEWSAFKEAPYTLYLIGAFFFFWSVYVGFFFVGAYARDILHAPQSTSIALLMAMNGVGAISRMLFNIIADKFFGTLNMMMVAVIATGLICFCWIAVDSIPGLWLFAVFYGVTSSAIQGLHPAVLTSLTTDPKKAGVRAGMGFGVVAWACLSGAPIAGVLIQSRNGSYLYCQIFAGVCMFISVGFMVACRTARIGWHVKVKV